MKKFFIVAQVHGSYTTLISQLNKANFNFKNKKDILVVLGNFFGYGSEQIKLFNFLKKLKDVGKAIILKGVEENFFLSRKNFFPIPLENELKKLKLNKKNVLTEITSFLKSCPYYFENSKYIFVSAGINPNLKNWKETKESGLYWCDSMIWMFNDQLKRLRNGDFKKIHKIVITGFKSSSNYHFYMKKGFLENYLNPNKTKNIPFKKDNFISIGGSWNYENNRIIYTV